MSPTIHVTNATVTGTITYQEQGGGGNPSPPSSSKVDETVYQNTEGNSEGVPLGVPKDYDWIGGKIHRNDTPPDNCTAVAGWGQIYPEEGQRVVAGDIQIADFQTWLLLKTGEWIKAQDSAEEGHQIDGEQYPANFYGDNRPWNRRVNSDGSVTVDSPPDGYNDHFWPGSRGTYQAKTVAGLFSMVKTKVADSSMRFVINIGADWWIDEHAPFVEIDGEQINNPGVGMNNWIKLSTDWRYSYFVTMNEEQLRANPPPPLRV